MRKVLCFIAIAVLSLLPSLMILAGNQDLELKGHPNYYYIYRNSRARLYILPPDEECVLKKEAFEGGYSHTRKINVYAINYNTTRHQLVCDFSKGEELNIDAGTLYNCYFYSYENYTSYECYIIKSSSIPTYQTTCSNKANKILVPWIDKTKMFNSKNVADWDERASWWVFQDSVISRWERSFDNGATWENIANTKFSYTEENPQAGTVMYRALGGGGKYSDVVTVHYQDAVPDVIQTLPATNTKTVDETITLNADVKDDGYSYQWFKNGDSIKGATSSSYTISTIKSSHTGNYTCVVANGCNEVTSTPASLNVNKCPQTIDLTEIPAQVYSAGLTYTLPKTTNKGLVITYQSLNAKVATVTDNIITILSPGTAIITATQVGNEDYEEAAPISRQLIVNKRSQTITFGELPTKKYEDLPFTLPETTDEGLTITYTSTNTSVATVKGNTVTILKPGTTDIIASQAGDAYRYAATEVSQTLTVNKAAQAITFNSLSTKTYGDAPFSLTKVSNKDLPIAYTSTDPTIASVEGNTVTINKPGTVQITASQTGNAYYSAAAPITQSLTIRKANQVIDFANIESRVYGTADFELPAKTDKGQDIVYSSSNTDVATIKGNVVHIVGAGTTNITAEQAGNDYYNPAIGVTQSLQVTKAYQTITFDELPACTYGCSPITLEATVNSDLHITYESSDPAVATIEGNVMTIVGAGQCYVTASVAGDKNHYSATPIERTLVVNKAVPTITFEALPEKTYGDEAVNLVAVSNTSAPVTFTSSEPKKVMIVGNQALLQAAGTYTITASIGTTKNYTEATATQTIHIAKAPLTLTANSISRLYGEANPKLTYSATGLVNGDTKYEIADNVTITTPAEVGSSVGTYEIGIKASVHDNYTFTCQKGVLTIEKALLSITATNMEKEYGDPNPDFQLSYTGFRNGDTETSLAVRPSAYTTAKVMSGVGTYPIYVNGASSQNYDIQYTNGTLTIQPAKLWIVVNNYSRKYGESNPQFEVQYRGFKGTDDESVLSQPVVATTNAIQNSPAGTYDIMVGSTTADNYIVENQVGKLTIAKAPLTIAANNATRKRGEENPTFTLSFNGFKCNESENVLDKLPTIQCNATASSPAGKYAIMLLSDGEDNNYTYILKNGILTVTPALYTITVNGSAYGTVTGGGTYEENTQITITASPRDGYQFAYWDDGNTDNPRTITVVSDATYTAIFTQMTAVDNIPADAIDTPCKVFRDGQVYILRGGKTYTLTGEKVD